VISADLGRHAEYLAHLADLGFDEIYVHHVGKEGAQQEAFVDAFAEHVLPQVRRERA